MNPADTREGRDDPRSAEISRLVLADWWGWGIGPALLLFWTALACGLLEGWL